MGSRLRLFAWTTRLIFYDNNLTVAPLIQVS